MHIKRLIGKLRNLRGKGKKNEHSGRIRKTIEYRHDEESYVKFKFGVKKNFL